MKMQEIRTSRYMCTDVRIEMESGMRAYKSMGLHPENAKTDSP